MAHLLDVPSVALRLGIRRHQVKKMVAADQIPHLVLPDGTIAFQEQDIDAWLASLSRPTRNRAEAGELRRATGGAR